MLRHSKLNGPDLQVEHVHPLTYQREQGRNWSRLVVGCQRPIVPVMLELCRDLPEPFSLLYVLLVSRTGQSTARYLTKNPLSYDDLELLLYTFQEYLEDDGRHHLWLMDGSGQVRLVYDHHNLLYAYGSVDGYEAKLQSRGYAVGRPEIPSPHTHNYHPQYDDAEAEFIEDRAWEVSPLMPEDDP